MMIRAMIKLLVVVIFLGILVIWIMAPTKMYNNVWMLKINAKANTTYFGAQGANILEYAFPMLLVATLGCIYLHLGKKRTVDSKPSKNNGLSVWKRPVLVNGPLGVVSGIEMTFVIMFLALLIWSFGVYLQVGFSDITYKSAHAYGETVWESRLFDAALILGYVGNICLAFLFFPVTRGSSVLQLLGLTSESSIKYHIWLGHITMTIFTAHGLCYIVFWGSTQRFSDMLLWANTGVSNLAGELSLLAGLAMWATTFPRIRRKMFELFFYTHYLYIVFVVFFVFHVGIAYAGMMLPGFYLFLVDRYLRFLQSRRNVRLLSSRILPCEAVELNFLKSTGLEYSPTSIMFINVPSISKLQWHPFTVTSNSNLESDNLSVVIKSDGSWTQKLYQKLSSPSSIERLGVSVEGPYGPASTNFLRHDTIVMISGGSGITPFFSIIRELIFTSATMNTKTPQILLISVFKNMADLTMLDLILPISGTPSDISGLQLQIEAYITRAKQQTMSGDNKNQIRTVWFKPNASDQPVSPILGANNWLWLATIICSSFIMFLVLLGVITRYDIYHVDHNTNMIFSSASRAAISMFLICACIVLTSSVVVFKNKNRNAMEAKRVQVTNTQTPTASPGPGIQNHEIELESLPYHALVEATNLHYGSRPNFKKILLELEGSSVGVLVSGPKRMRHDVASICSSSLAYNLHFESISFSW